jgi:hypothetical protein
VKKRRLIICFGAAIAVGAIAFVVMSGGIAPSKPAKATTITDGPTVEVLDSVRIPWDFRVSELSGAAWDEDEQLLYVVSDLGHIIHFKIDLKDNKIAKLDRVFFGPLGLATGGQKLADAEDLVAIDADNGKKGDSKIAVVFEDGPAAAEFSATGEPINTIALPTPLIAPDAYRQVNQRLESIALTPDHGFIMAPQTPLVGQSHKHHILYATDGTQWRYKASQKKRSSTKSLEQMPDGSLLVLEAVNDGGFLGAIGLGGKEAHIRRLNLAACADARKCPVIDYPTSDGQPIRGRFEGITHIKDDLFVMVTDETFGSEMILIRVPSTTAP